MGHFESILICAISPQSIHGDTDNSNPTGTMTMKSQIALATEALPRSNQPHCVDDQFTDLPMSILNYMDCHDFIKRSQATDSVYLFDKMALRNKVLEFKAGFPGEVSYAVKANPRLDILDLLWRSGVKSFDVADLLINSSHLFLIEN